MKTKTTWTPKMITEMVTLVEGSKKKQTGINKAAKVFKVTPNAIAVKYNRIKKSKNTSTTIVAKVTKTKNDKVKVIPSTTFAGKNLFKIDRNTPLIGNRRGHLSKELLALADVAKNLGVSQNESIRIPKSIAKTKSDASNLVLGLKRYAAQSKDFPKDFTVTLRTTTDAEGNYVETRIWRTA